MSDDASTDDSSDDRSATELADRLQAIDEQIAAGVPPNRWTDSTEHRCDTALNHQIERVKNVFQIINNLRSRDDHYGVRATDTDTDAATGKSPQIGFKIGNYVVEEEIARGGMGIVFQARDLKLNRRVALKILRAGPLARDEDRIRFRGEAEAAARLDHPGIVPVYEVGDQHGVLYYTMGIVEGPSLSDLVRQSPLEPSRAANIAKQIAEAADYAHQRGIVHRDIKPSNVLFDRFDRIRVADFGLARRVDGGSDLTETGQVVGTPEYMAPEQAAGNASTAGPPADIYSIGATLYCMLTGYPPFRSSSSVETLRKVMEQDPISLRKLNRSVAADLETICLRCLEKQPSKRYPDAAALADDLQRYLIGEPIQARRPRLPERTARWVRRYPLAASFVSVLVVLAVLGPIIATSQMRLANEAQSARNSMARTLYISDMNLAIRDWDEANLQRCGELLRRHIPRDGGQDLRGFEWYYLWRNWQQSQNVPIVFEDSQLETIAVSADGRLLAAGCFDGRLVLWDLQDNQKIREWQAHPYRTYRIDFSRDAKTLASASIDNEVTLWDVASGDRLHQFNGSRAVSLSPAGDAIAYRTQGSRINIHHGIGALPTIVIDAEEDFVEALSYSPNGSQIASGGWGGQIKLWDSKSGESVQVLGGGQGSIWSLAWSSIHPLLVSGHANGSIRLWNTDRHELLSAFSSHSETIYDLEFSPDGEWLASASADNTVAIRSLAGGQLVRRLKGHSAEVKSVVFTDQGHSLLTASCDGTVKKWNLDRQDGLDLLEHPELVTSVAFFPDGNKIVTACYDGKVRCWNVQSGKLENEFVAHQSNVWQVRLIKLDGRSLIVTSGQDGAIRIWDAETFDKVRQLPAIENALDPLAFAISPDHSRIAFSSARHEAVIWDLRGNRQITSFTPGKVDDIVFSPDGRQIIICSANLMSIWDAMTGRQAIQWTEGTRPIERLQFSPDGQTLTAVTYDRLVKIWQSDSLLNLRSGEPVPPKLLTGSAGILASLAITNDGTTIASSGDDQVIRLWDSATGQQRAALVGHTGSVVDLAFSPDDQVLVSASSDRTVRLWRGNRDVADSQPLSQ